jgi:hypothetical protein
MAGFSAIPLTPLLSNAKRGSPKNGREPEEMALPLLVEHLHQGFSSLKSAGNFRWIALLGPQVVQMDKKSAQVTGPRHAVAQQSGPAALHITLRMLGARPGYEVVTASASHIRSVWWSTSHEMTTSKVPSLPR